MPEIDKAPLEGDDQAPEVQDLPEPVEADGDETDDEGIDWKAATKKARKESEKRQERLKELELKLQKQEEADKKRAEEKRKEEGKYKELLEEKEKEMLELQEKAARLDVLEAQVRTDLLEKLPKKLQTKYESIDVELLRDIVSDFAEQTRGSGSVGADPVSKGSKTPESWASMTTEQQLSLLKDNPTLASKLINEQGARDLQKFR